MMSSELDSYRKKLGSVKFSLLTQENSFLWIFLPVCGFKFIILVFFHDQTSPQTGLV